MRHGRTGMHPACTRHREHGHNTQRDTRGAMRSYQRCKRAVRRAVLVGLPVAPNGLASAVSGPDEAQCSWRRRQSVGFEDGCGGGIWALDPAARHPQPDRTALIRVDFQAGNCHSISAIPVIHGTTAW